MFPPRRLLFNFTKVLQATGKRERSELMLEALVKIDTTDLPLAEVQEFLSKVKITEASAAMIDPKKDLEIFSTTSIQNKAAAQIQKFARRRASDNKIQMHHEEHARRKSRARPMPPPPPDASPIKPIVSQPYEELKQAGKNVFMYAVW